METKIIQTSKLARQLIKKRFNLLDIMPNKNNPDKTVFVFEFTDALKSFLDSYKK